jgi:hypothetical protein
MDDVWGDGDGGIGMIVIFGRLMIGCGVCLLDLLGFSNVNADGKMGGKGVLSMFLLEIEFLKNTMSQ